MKSSVAEEVDGRSVAWERAGRPPAERVTGGRKVSGRWRVVRGGSGRVCAGEDGVAGCAAEEVTDGGRQEEIQAVV